MSMHVFGAVVTGMGTAANNRGLTEGNTTTLQKLVWNGQVHTTVSAEAIRFALRRQLAGIEPTNRKYDEDERTNTWADHKFERWNAKSKEKPFIDDDLLGFMQAEAGKQEGEKGGARVRRSVLEITRAISLTPWHGDVTFNAASPGATPSAQKKKGGNHPTPYGTEMHATRYQYGFAMTPARLAAEKAHRAAAALRALCSLGEVAGNHGRFLFDFSPDSIVLRFSEEAAPRILYAFEIEKGGGVGIGQLLRKVRSGDVPAKELIIGGTIVDTLSDDQRGVLAGAELLAGVRAACERACERIASGFRS